MMILDTNVLSAFAAITPDPTILSWLNRQDPESVWITAVTVYEACFGIALLPDGRKREALSTALHDAVNERLSGRVLPFDTPAAETAGRLAAERRKTGRPIDIRDTQIAGIVLSRKARLATRNHRHFDDLDIEIINPWTQSS